MIAILIQSMIGYIIISVKIYIILITIHDYYLTLPYIHPIHKNLTVAAYINYYISAILNIVANYLKTHASQRVLRYFTKSSTSNSQKILYLDVIAFEYTIL